MNQVKKCSTTEYLLKALIPYTEQNLKLVFKPGQFFKELEKSTRSNRNTLAATMSRARKKGLILDYDGVPVLTEKGLKRLRTSSVDEISGWLMVTFDIPESKRGERDQFRYYLKVNGFKTLQKSVWYTTQDRTEELKDVVSELGLGSHVCIFIAASVFAPGLSLYDRR
jgi:DNA-binding transcriptional regulator PaaX